MKLINLILQAIFLGAAVWLWSGEFVAGVLAMQACYAAEAILSHALQSAPMMIEVSANIKPQASTPES